MFRPLSRPAAPLPLAAAVATLAAMTACTSDGDQAPPDQAEQTLEGSVPESDWWCRLIERPLVEAVAGERTDQAREVLRQNDTDGFRCEVSVPDGEGGADTALTLAVAIDDQARAEQLRAAAEEAGAGPGPDHLGESYVWPSGVVAILPCDAPAGHEKQHEPVTYVFSLLAEQELDMPDEMEDPVRRSLMEADQAVGCSPSEAHRRSGQG